MWSETGRCRRAKSCVFVAPPSKTPLHVGRFQEEDGVRVCAHAHLKVKAASGSSSITFVTVLSLTTPPLPQVTPPARPLFCLLQQLGALWRAVCLPCFPRKPGRSAYAKHPPAPAAASGLPAPLTPPSLPPPLPIEMNLTATVYVRCLWIFSFFYSCFRSLRSAFYSLISV